MSESIRGTILYTSNQPHRTGEARGAEHFSITRNADCTRSLRSHCVIQDPPMVERDVVLSVDERFHPRTAQVRIRIGDDQEGAALFRFANNVIYSAGKTIDGVVYDDVFESEEATSFFVTHPIQADAWLLASLNTDEEPCVRRVENFPTCSIDHRGATGPRLAFHVSPIDIHFLGIERIQVMAGEFDAKHFCYGDPADNPEGANIDGQHPRYHVWTSADGDYILLRAQVDGYMQTHYELSELVRGPAGSI